MQEDVRINKLINTASHIQKSEITAHSNVGTRHAVSEDSALNTYKLNKRTRRAVSLHIYEMTTKLPQRKSPRAKWLDYNDGQYFVTVCTHNWIHYFGEIVDGNMQLSQIGLYLTECLENTQKHQPYINILQYVVMPNHFHAIIDIEQTDKACRVPTCEERIENGIQHFGLPLLSTYIGSLKSAVTKYAHTVNSKFTWQKRYYDHAIRGTDDRNNISRYIENNVTSWDCDCFNKQA